MTITASIYKGDTAGPWLLGIVDTGGALRPLTIDDSCLIKVIGTAIQRAVTDRTPDALQFRAALLPAETATLQSGSQYVVVVQVENLTLTPPLRREEHIVLTVNAEGIGGTDTPVVPSEMDRLIDLRDALRKAQIEAVNGAVVEVWNGRYGNRMKYDVMTYAQIRAALVQVDTDIANEEARLSGRGRRRPIGLVWKH